MNQSRDSAAAAVRQSSTDGIVDEPLFGLAAVEALLGDSSPLEKLEARLAGPAEVL